MPEFSFLGGLSLWIKRFKETPLSLIQTRGYISLL